MKIYTKTGDEGITSLYGGERMVKEEIFFEVLGELDELSSRIGMLYAYLFQDGFLKRKDKEIFIYLGKIQEILQDINSNIATIKKIRKIPPLNNSIIEEIETKIDFIESKNSKLTKFIIPGCIIIDSQAHLCRTQSRKVERKLWKLQRATDKISVKTCSEKRSYTLNLSEIVVEKVALRFLNRLSDFFFVLARYLCNIMNIQERYKE